jgi:dolichol-phosphate mannosyltransferase
MVDSSRIARPLLVVPTYNEASNMASLIDDVTSLLPSLELLVVDDASPDGTAAAVRAHPLFGSRVHLMERPGKLGLGTAYHDGFRWGLERGYSCFLEMDADRSHDHKDIPGLLSMIAAGADLAVGSRYVNGVRVLNWPARRLLLSLFASAYTRFWTGLPLTDPTSGFKAIHRDVLARVPWKKMTSGGYSFQIELHFYLWRAGARIGEWPIVFTERRVGASKMSTAIAREAAIRVPLLGLERCTGR